MDYEPARKRFGHRLQNIRTERGLTQEQLAEIISKSTEHISLLERGARSPSFEVLLDLARVLEAPIASFFTGEAEYEENLVSTLIVAPISAPLPAPAQVSPSIQEQRGSDLERLNAAFIGIQEMQTLADEYGISDILQDNGGKVLQVLILLGLKISPGREGNDAIDREGHEYELKTVNRGLNKNAGITTHHHLNYDILRKYRSVRAWYIAIYEGIELQEIYKLSPTKLEPMFAKWEQKLDAGLESLNNPKIPMHLVREEGDLVYQKE